MKQLEITQVPKLTFEVKEALNQFRMNLGFCGKKHKENHDYFFFARRREVFY